MGEENINTQCDEWFKKRLIREQNIKKIVPGGGTLFTLGPVSTWVLTGKKKGGWSPPKVLPVSTIVLTGKKKGGWSP